MPRSIRDHQIQNMHVQADGQVTFEIRTALQLLPGEVVLVDDHPWTVHQVAPAAPGTCVFRASAQSVHG